MLAREMQAGMMDCPMMSSGIDCMEPGARSDGGAQEGVMNRMQQMEKRLDMMQMMMEQSMRGQAGQTAPPTK